MPHNETVIHEVIDGPAKCGVDAVFEVEASNAANQLAVIRNEQDTLVRAVAARVGYQLPGDSVTPDLIQRDIAANMRRSVEACLEVGRALVVLKQACPHGEFLMRLDGLGIDARVAQRFMHAGLKFSNAASTPLLAAIGNQTKLFEMLVLDDEAIEELALTGQTGELQLDDVATMSVKELRAALRANRQDLAATEKVLSDKQTHITKLERKLHTKVAAVTDWGDAITPLCDQAAEAGRKIAQAFTQLAEVRKAACAIETADDAERARLESAFAHLALKFGGALAECARLLDAEESLYERSLAAFAAE